MSQPRPRILDSHIHLWPSTATSPSCHGWMTPDHALAKRHGISDYLSIASSPTPTGFIYVETDRYLPSTFPPDPPSASTDNTTTISDQAQETLSQWAQQPLQELLFLRRIAERTPSPDDSDGFTPANADKMKGCVVYAPLHLSPALFAHYLLLAERTAGPVLWPRVVGFRSLLQGRGADAVQRLLLGEHESAWVRNLRALARGRGGKGWAFDVGVDVHRDGVAVLGAVQKLIQRVRADEASEGVGAGKGVRFVLNHLAKHPLSPCSPPPPPLPAWREAMASLGSDAAVYMKFSGALNEFVDAQPTPDHVPTLLRSVAPLFDHVLACFGPGRILFGSDWPVCNVGGPRGDEGNWNLWTEVVEAWMRERALSDEDQERIWSGTACEAYGVEM